MEVFVPFHVRDLLVLPECLSAIKSFLQPIPARIVVVGCQLPTRLPATLQQMNVQFIDESTVMPGLSPRDIPQILASREDQTGWYFQQLLKFALGRIAHGPAYAVVDADCVLLHPTPLQEDGKTILYRGGSLGASPSMLQRLLGFIPDAKAPFVGDFMLFDSALVSEMLRLVEGNNPAKPWPSAILDAATSGDSTGWSAAQTYGQYVTRFHSELFLSRAWQVAVVSRDLIAQHTRSRPILLQRGYHSASYPSHNLGEVSALLGELATMVDLACMRVMLDVGSRDAQVALAARRALPNAVVYAFECNPPAVELCRLNIGARTDVVLIDKAVSDETGPVDFYAIDPHKTLTPHADGNIGASSLFKANPNYPAERYVQQKITVHAIRLEDWARENAVDQIDLLWMDLQGAELKALQGLGELIHRVKFIYTEVDYQPLYLGQPTHVQLYSYLESHSFRLHRRFNTFAWFGNELWVRTDIGPRT